VVSLFGPLSIREDMVGQVSMATSRITVRTIDYHKFRSLVIERDGVGDELRQRCDAEVSALCDAVRRLYDRRDRFDDDVDDFRQSDTSRDGRDLARFGEICGWYKLILENRRVRSVDVRLRSCWWQVNGEPFKLNYIAHVARYNSRFS